MFNRLLSSESAKKPERTGRPIRMVAPPADEPVAAQVVPELAETADAAPAAVVAPADEKSDPMTDYCLATALTRNAEGDFMASVLRRRDPVAFDYDVAGAGFADQLVGMAEKAMREPHGFHSASADAARAFVGLRERRQDVAVHIAADAAMIAALTAAKPASIFARVREDAELGFARKIGAATVLDAERIVQAAPEVEGRLFVEPVTGDLREVLDRHEVHMKAPSAADFRAAIALFRRGLGAALAGADGLDRIRQAVDTQAGFLEGRVDDLRDAREPEKHQLAVVAQSIFENLHERLLASLDKGVSETVVADGLAEMRQAVTTMAIYAVALVRRKPPRREAAAASSEA